VDSTLGPALERYTAAIHQLLNYQKQQARSIAAESAALYRSSRLMLMGLGSLAIGLGILFAWLLTRSIVRPLKNAVDLAQRIAEGKLNTEFAIDRHDEIGQLLQALQAMNASLAQTIHIIDQEANAINDAAGQMVQRNAGLSNRTEIQARTLEQTAAAVEQVTAAVRQNAGHAQQARQLAESATELAGLGSQDINEAIATMQLMKHGTGQVGEISSVIDGIAFQTNILALNATVEAARAGTHGRSFAVVAAEVRRLAQRSALAAKEINSLIDGLIEQIHRGDALTSAAGKTMHRIVDASRHVADIINDISVASQEQSVGIQQTNQAIIEMEQATQRNAVFVKESALTAQKLQRQALNLRQAVGFFTLAQGSAARLAPAVTVTPQRSDMAADGNPVRRPALRPRRHPAILAEVQ
jgi:methyl-accepting chemotaxis protein